MLSFVDFHARFEKIARQLGATLLPLSNNGWTAKWGTSPFFVILSGLHGDEISGPLAILQWLERLHILAMRRRSNSSVTSFQSSPRQDLQVIPPVKIKNKFRHTLSFDIPPIQGLWIVPLINDVGWDNHQRTWLSLDLNRSFNHSAPYMIREIMAGLQSKEVNLFLDIHEDDSIEQPFVFHFTGDQHSLAIDLAAGLEIIVEPWSNPSEWETASDLFARRLGCHYSLTLETPTRWPLKGRIELNIKAIEWLMRNLVIG